MTELSIVIPTFNERLNLEPLIERLSAVLRHISWEVVFVDDNSPDQTAEAVRALARVNPRVRCVHRIGRRGLSSACVEGVLATASPYIAIMDGDLQHDESLLPDMLRSLKEEKLDIVVGSRYVDGGSIGEWDSNRAAASRLATRLAQIVVRANLNDPMSGFMMFRREVMHDALPRLSAIGFKILLDLFASSPRPLKFRELPFRFRNRHAGESKLDTQVMWDYIMLLLDKTIGRYVPVRFITFSAVGGLGLIVHMATLAALFRGAGSSFLWAQAAATLVAMTSNFIVNNVVTYRDRRLKGWGWLKGWASFAVVCSVGSLANIGVAAYLFDLDRDLWALSAIAGVLVGAVWNYAVTSLYTWRAKTA
jgi:dolichol-phosphate mannosyltransferase